MTGVYAIFNITTRRYYIGSSWDMLNRWREHCRQLRNSTHDNKELQKAFDLFGISKLSFRILEVCERSQLLEREQIWLNKIQNKYNVLPTAGSALGRKMTPEHKAKLSARAKARWRDPETRAMYQGFLGSAQTKARISNKAKQMWDKKEFRDKMDKSGHLYKPGWKKPA